MRGGVSYISQRYSKASNNYLKSYDPKKRTKYIMYLDKNNIYGYVMEKSPLWGELAWLDRAKHSFDK